MKKNLALFLTLIFSVLMITSAIALPRDYSYRKYGTAEFFKNNYDRISDNPAYVGAKIKIFDYVRVKDAGGEEDQKSSTDLYTTLDGLNTNGRFLLGGLTSLGVLGVGGYLEIGSSETPQNLNFNTGGIGNTQVNLSGTGSGSGEGSDAYYTGASGAVPYSQSQVLSANQEYYTKDNHLNARIALGGLALGPMILGLSFQRSTENPKVAVSSLETIEKGGYSFSQTRLSDSLVEDARKASFDHNTTNKLTSYLTAVGLVFAIGGVLQTVELMLTYNILQYKMETMNTGTISQTVQGAFNYTLTQDGNIRGTGIVSDKDDQSGSELGINLLTREQIGSWHLATFVRYNKGGINPNKDRMQVYQDGNAGNFNFVVPNPNEITSQSTVGNIAYAGDGRSRSVLGAGLLSRKEVAKGLLFGFGLAYEQDSSKNEYTRAIKYTQTTRVDDGDGINEATDTTTVTSGSYKEGITDENISHSFIVPIGLEYQATSSLCWRFGATHRTTYSSAKTHTKVTDANDLYSDVDRADIAGNEPDNDAKTNASTIATALAGGFNFDTTNRDKITRSVTKTMTNEFFIGLGYLMASKVQLDMLMSVAAVNTNRFTAGSIFAAATYMIE